MFKSIRDQFPTFKAIILVSFLVTGNILGVGVLALPVKAGLSGFIPALSAVCVIWFLMLVSAFIILKRLPQHQKHFDIPSFYHREIGRMGYFLAILCNLIILYGVIVAYLSGMSTLLVSLLHIHIPQQMIILGYFLIVTILIISNLHALIRGNMILLLALFVCFLILVATSTQPFDWQKLTGH
jgi:tyrosine-specific transport protein